MTESESEKLDNEIKVYWQGCVVEAQKRYGLYPVQTIRGLAEVAAAMSAAADYNVPASLGKSNVMRWAYNSCYDFCYANCARAEKMINLMKGAPIV